MFIGRENELDTLNRLYHSDKFEFENHKIMSDYCSP